MTATTDFSRLESKVDKIADAVSKLVVLEERQSHMKSEVDDLKAEMAEMKEELNKTQQTLAKWVYIGHGAITVIVVLWSVFTFFVGGHSQHLPM